VQNAEPKIANVNVNHIHGSPRRSPSRQTAQKFSTLLKTFVQPAENKIH
jgi:hypothetical protein